MQIDKTGALKRRIAPGVPLTLELEDDSGGRLKLNFRLSFDFNAIAEVEERCGCGFLNGEVWRRLDARTVSVMLWAAMLAHQPEYAGEEGLCAVRTYLDAGNFSLVSEKLLDAYLASLPADKRAAMTALKERALKGEAAAKGASLDGGAAPENPTAPPATAAPAPDGSSAGPPPATTSG